MNLRHHHARLRRSCEGGALIITLWVAFGLVSLALYFGYSMSLELKASDYRAAGYASDQAISGAARYVIYLLTNLQQPGVAPDLTSYQRAAVPVGDAVFWMIGRDDLEASITEPFFRLSDEASKLNLNVATREMLETLPRMTSELAAAIIDWRDSDSEVTTNGAEDETYQRRTPPYKCKNAKFESVEELRLVNGADMDILYGEDTNRNGVLDPNENDGELTPPFDNKDGKLDPGILEYVTVYSQESNTRADGTNRVSVQDTRQLQQLIDSLLPSKRITVPPNLSSPLELYALNKSNWSADEFAQIEDYISVTNGTSVVGLVNVATASEAVLACIPGIGVQNASSLVAYRRSHQDKVNSVAWVAEVISDTSALRQAGPWLTGRSYQFTADIAAADIHQRGYRRVKFIIDTTETTPKIIHRQDLSALGWALGKDVRQRWLLAKGTR